jgi:hypothetical protein
MGAPLVRIAEKTGRLDPSAVEMGECAAGRRQEAAGSMQRLQNHIAVFLPVAPLPLPPPRPPPKHGPGQGARASNSGAARTTNATSCGETCNPRAPCVMRRHQEKRRSSGIVPRTLALISMPAAGSRQQAVGSRQLVENGRHRRQMSLRDTFSHRRSPIAHRPMHPACDMPMCRYAHVLMCRCADVQAPRRPEFDGPSGTSKV